MGVADRTEFLRDDAAWLPSSDDHPDAVLAMWFFRLTDALAKFLAEMARVLKGQVFFDTFNDGSLRMVYNWLLSMGSQLYSEHDVRRLLDDAGLDLVGAKHDSVIPFGFYRKVPNGIAQASRSFDFVVDDSPLGDDLASVLYWNARVESADESSRVATWVGDAE